VFDTGLLNKEELLVGIENNNWKISHPEKNAYAVEQEISDLDSGKDLLPKPNPSKLHVLDLEDDTLEVGYVNLGNPHAINFSTKINDMPLDNWGHSLQASEWFPKGVNLTLAEMKSPKEINIRVFERGVGETLACGSGACAAVVIGVQLGYLQQEVQVNFKKGSLYIKYDLEDQGLISKGAADFLEEINILV
jgi:diaminopimelate epimerase